MTIGRATVAIPRGVLRGATTDSGRQVGLSYALVTVVGADRRAFANGNFSREYPEARAGLILYGGREVTWVTDTVLAVPWWRVL